MGDSTSATAQVLEEFFAAIEAGDFETVQRLYDDDIQIWHSVTNETQDKRANLRLLAWLRGGAAFKYELQEQVVDGDTAARRHVLHVGADGHPPLAIPAALFVTVHDGRITRIDEYVDSALTQRLLSSMPGTSH